jgi:hypothetical protein
VKILKHFDPSRLSSALQAGAGIDYASLRQTHPSLFSAAAIEISASTAGQIAGLVSAIERAVATPAYQAAALSWSPAIARNPVAARSVFFGYDFHLSAAGPRLIEINTNAGGALLNACLLRAYGCVAEAEALEQAVVAMFRREWQLSRGDQRLRRIAIVDEQPAQQYLAPEFRLFRQLFERAGISAVIADPAALKIEQGQLVNAGAPIDLIYNRLTDFALDSTVNAAIRSVFEAGGVVLTPHPRAHGLYADKRNLVLLSDPAALTECGLEEATRAVLLAGVPQTRLVHAEEGEQFWADRKRWFFKPAAGFGSRAAYRGDKLTKRVFEEILKGGYIAQEIAPPSEHPVLLEGSETMMKADIRAYVYEGQVQLLAARLYQGQTTNFRTPGGGFAPVFISA